MMCDRFYRLMRAPLDYVDIANVAMASTSTDGMLSDIINTIFFSDMCLKTQ